MIPTTHVLANLVEIIDFFEKTRSSKSNFNISNFLTIIFKYSKSTSKSHSYLKFQQIVPSFFFPVG
jgi:hypothetical protein